jgi:hypothetical protein
MMTAIMRITDLAGLAFLLQADSAGDRRLPRFLDSVLRNGLALARSLGEIAEADPRLDPPPGRDFLYLLRLDPGPRLDHLPVAVPLALPPSIATEMMTADRNPIATAMMIDVRPRPIVTGMMIGVHPHPIATGMMTAGPQPIATGMMTAGLNPIGIGMTIAGPQPIATGMMIAGRPHPIVMMGTMTIVGRPCPIKIAARFAGLPHRTAGRVMKIVGQHRKVATGMRRIAANAVPMTASLLGEVPLARPAVGLAVRQVAALADHPAAAGLVVPPAAGLVVFPVADLAEARVADLARTGRLHRVSALPANNQQDIQKEHRRPLVWLPVFCLGR